MGGGDLNMKKSWHPGLIKNRAQVWEDQHAALQERKRIEALKKEIEEERAANELQKLNEANGGVKRQERVDFLYAGPGAGSGLVEDREAYLLGKKRIDDVLGKDTVGKEVGPSAGSSATASSGGLNMRDIANKISMDPLLAIKKQEAAQYEALVNRKKAEIEAEARKAARRGARRSHDDDRQRSSRSRRSSPSRSRYRECSGDRVSPSRSKYRDHDNDRKDKHSHRSSRREYSSSREREHGSDRNRTFRSSHHSRDDYESRRSSYRRDRSRSSSPHSDRRDSDRYSRSRPHQYPKHRSRRETSRSASPNSSRAKATPSGQGSFTVAQDAEAERKAAREAQLAEMTASASELDAVRDRRLREAQARDEAERALEDAGRKRDAALGTKSGYVRQMQLSAGLVR